MATVHRLGGSWRREAAWEHIGPNSQGGAQTARSPRPMGPPIARPGANLLLSAPSRPYATRQACPGAQTLTTSSWPATSARSKRHLLVLIDARRDCFLFGAFKNHL